MQCPKCGSPVNPGQKFCTKCGQPINAAPQQPVKSSTNVCPSCGAPLNPGQKFCTKCGTKIDVTPQPAQKAVPGEKGFIDNVRHLGTFVRQGSEGVDRLVRREREAEVRQQAADLGLEVNKPPRGGQQSQPVQSAPVHGSQSAPALGGQANPQNNQPQPQQPQVRRLMVDNTSVAGVNLVSGRAIWDIKKGEVARLITESEFANAEGLKGVIVQEGCSALIFIDGSYVSTLSSGVYTFPSKTVAELEIERRNKELELEQKQLDEREKQLKREEYRLEFENKKKDDEYARTFAARGILGEIAAGARWVGELMCGREKEETVDDYIKRMEKQREKAEKEKEKKQQKLNGQRLVISDKICRVYIVSNRVINLIFGSQETAEGMVDFAPMVIPTKLVDINVAVSMQLEIGNINEFVKNYLADRKSVSILDFQQMLMPGVKATLIQMLRNFDYQQEGLPEPVVNNLKGKLQMTCGERLFGIRVVKVLDITDSSADFERFRAVERELYASEKELGFLQRTGEFRNRLEQEQNKQTVDHAQNEEQLRQALQAVNKDKLLSEDEMEQFVMLLNSQKRIRQANMQKDEAIAMEEVREALIDIKKSGLVKDDEFAALEHQLLQGRMDRDDVTAAHENEIEQRRIDRENVTQIMRIQAQQKVAMSQQIADFELSDSKMEHEMANALRLAQHQGNLAVAKLDTQRLMDAYSDERNEFDWNRAFSRRQQEDAYNDQRQEHKEDRAWEQQQRQQQANNQQAMFEQQLREQQAQADYNRARQDKMDDIDILERKGNIAMRNMQAMKEAELRAQQEANRSAESIHSMDVNVEMNRDNVEANMSAEQLMAKRAAQLDASAQAAFANALSSGKENELRAQQQAEQKALYEQMMAQQNAQNTQNQQMMMQMAQMMQQGMMGIGQQQMQNQQAMFNQQQQFQQQRYDDQVQMKQEYQQQAQYAQQRQDHAQDQAFGAMGGVATAAAGNLYTQNTNTNINVQQPQQPQYQEQYQPQQPAGRFCSACGAVVPEGEMFCGECGQKM